MDDSEENDNTEQRKKLLDLGKKIQQSKPPKKSPTKTQKEMKYWKNVLATMPEKTPRIDEEKEEEKEEEKDCSLGDLCSVSGGKKSRKNKRRKRITRKFKKNRKFKKTSYKR